MCVAGCVGAVVFGRIVLWCGCGLGDGCVAEAGGGGGVEGGEVKS